MRRTILTLALAILALALPAAASAKIPASFYGISAVDPTDHDFSRIEGTGFGAARFEFSWRIIQKTRKSGYDWGYVDRLMKQIANAGLRPAPLLYGTPRFVRRSPDGFFPPTSSAENRQEWKDFLAAATRRYGPDGDFWAENPGLQAAPVRQWIIWNEQNARAFWRPKPNPSDYATLVKISDQAISEVDPDADIVLGGMFGYPHDSRSMFAADFLRKFYEAKGIERHFEAISLHPYGSGVGSVRKQVKQARTVVRRAGDPGVGILIGEMGWASSGPSSSEEVVGVKGQATRLRKGLELLLDKRRAWNIVGVYIYVWRDFTLPTACLWCPGAGLVELDGTAKPSLKAVRTVISDSR